MIIIILLAVIMGIVAASAQQQSPPNEAEQQKIIDDGIAACMHNSTIDPNDTGPVSGRPRIYTPEFQQDCLDLLKLKQSKMDAKRKQDDIAASKKALDLLQKK